MKKLVLAAILAFSTVSVQAADAAAEKAAYLEKQLKAFRDGTRKDPSMEGQSKTLTDDDIANLSAYYASL